MATDLYSQAKALYPFLPEELVRLFADSWTESGNPQFALMQVRQNRAVYDRYFPGNLREDGTIRLNEMEFLSTVEGYRARLSSFGVPPDVLLGPEKLRALIEGDVSPNEFGDKLDALYGGVLSQGDAIREAYASQYGISGLSDAAIFASAIDGTTSPSVFESRIRSAQVSGAAKERGFNLAKAEAERLSSFGLDLQAGRKLFSSAAKDLPALNDLIGRFNDPNDPLTINDYTEAIVIQDPKKMDVLTRLLGRQAASFSATSGQFATDQSGVVTGLVQR